MSHLICPPPPPDDAPAISVIYNQGIEDRVGTFETRLRTPDDVLAWFDSVHPIVVVEDGGRVVAFAATATYRPAAPCCARSASARWVSTSAMRNLTASGATWSSSSGGYNSATQS